VGLRGGLDPSEKKEICCPFGNEKPDDPSRRVINIPTVPLGFQQSDGEELVKAMKIIIKTYA